MHLEGGKVGALSYDHFVQDYKEECRTRYREFMEKGEVK
jgi:hypothetical protein